MTTYKYKNLPRGKDIILDLDNIIESAPRKIIFHEGRRASSKIFCNDSNNYKILSISFDHNGKLVEQYRSYSTFLQSVVAKSGDTTLLQKSTWSYYMLLLLSSLAMLLIAVIMFFIAYNTFSSYGASRQFYFHVVYALVPLTIAIFGISGIKKPTILTKDEAINLLTTIHKD